MNYVLHYYICWLLVYIKIVLFVSCLRGRRQSQLLVLTTFNGIFTRILILNPKDSLKYTFTLTCTFLNPKSLSRLDSTLSSTTTITFRLGTCSASSGIRSTIRGTSKIRSSASTTSRLTQTVNAGPTVDVDCSRCFCFSVASLSSYPVT
jgi:hypothetical protein